MGKYLVRGALLRCQCGSRESQLNLAESCGMEVAGESVVHEEDCKPGINISDFGICSVTAQPCKPIIPGPWLCVNKKVQIGGKSLVTDESALLCLQGGIILPQTTGQGFFQKLWASLPPKSLLNLLMGLNTKSPLSKDPVNLMTGNLVFEKNDLQISGSFPLSFVRTYNSLDQVQNKEQKKPLGVHWTHNHEISLVKHQDGIDITLEDGRIETHQRVSGGQYQGVAGCRSILKQTFDGFLLVTEEKNTYTFQQSGEIINKKDQYDNQTTYCHKDGKLSSVTTKGGSLYFEYDSKDRLVQVNDHIGRTVCYTYDEQDRLVAITDPNGHSYCYGYGEDGRIKEEINKRGIRVVVHESDEDGRVTRQMFADGGIMSYRYDDDDGRIVLTEQNGNRVKYYKDKKFRNIRTSYIDGYEDSDYNENNQIIQFRDKNKNVTRYEYQDTTKKLTKVINALGEETILTYDRKGNLLKVTRAGNTVLTSEYNLAGKLVALTDPIGRVMRLHYSTDGLIKDIEHPDGSMMSYQFDGRGNITEMKRPSGSRICYEYDDLNRVIRTTDGSGNATRYAYDDQDNLCKVTNAEGKERCYEYNQSDKVTKITDFDGSCVSREYNEVGKVTKVLDQQGHETSFTYDLMWNVATRMDANGAKTSYRYNRLNHLEAVTNALGHEVKYEYDPNGNQTKVIRGDGATITYHYDALNRKIGMVDADGSETKLSYNPYGQITSVTDAMGHVTSIDYNQAGQKVREVDPLGRITSYTYNQLGDLERLTDPAGRTTCYLYQAGGLLTQIQYPDGRKECYTYDANENLLTKSDHTGYGITYQYDCLNRMIAIKSSEGQEKSYTYDAVGNVKTMTDARGFVTTYSYTPAGKLSSVIDELQNETRYQYDAVGNLIQVIQCGEVNDELEEEREVANIWNRKREELRKTTYQWNMLGQMTGITDAMGLKEEYQYDEAGKLLKKIDKDGYHTGYTYTKTGELESVQYADGKSVKLSYNPLRQLQEVKDWLGTTTFHLDVVGRSETITDYKERCVSYEYGQMNERTKIIYPDGTEVRYQYDDQLKLQKVLEAGKTVVDYQYDKYGRLTAKQYPGESGTTYEYNAVGRISCMKHNSNDGLLDQYLYHYDPAGNKTEVKVYRRDLEEESGTFQYDYDPCNRLTKVTRNRSCVREYLYDPFGNRVMRKAGEQETSFTYNQLNQLQHAKTWNSGFPDQKKIREYQYDHRGNVRAIAQDGIESQTFLFDSANRLIQTMNPGGEYTKYQYQGLGQRVKSSKNGKHTEYILDMTRNYHNLLLKEDENEIQRFLWDAELLSTTVTNLTEDQGRNHERTMDQTGHYLLDGLGSPIRLLDDRGSLSCSYVFDEFGESSREIYESRGKRISQPLGFGSYQKEEEGLYFAQARYYDPFMGRFISEDIIKGNTINPQSLNPYSYCLNQMMDLVDFDGMEASWFDPNNMYTPAWYEGIYAHIQMEMMFMEIYGKGIFKTENFYGGINQHIPGGGITGGSGYADMILYNHGTAQIYEIKPISWHKNELKKQAGEDQLDRYIAAYKKINSQDAQKGQSTYIDVFLNKPMVYWLNRNKQITYTMPNPTNGMIYYEITGGKPQEQTSTVPAVEGEKEQEPSLATPLTLWELILAGAIAAGETIETGAEAIAGRFFLPMHKDLLEIGLGIHGVRDADGNYYN